MRVFFEQLVNDDWICRDAENTKGDLFVDPTKIDELMKFFPERDKWSHMNYDKTITYTTLYQDTSFELTGCGNVKLRNYVELENGVIKRAKIRSESGETIVVFPFRFTLDLPELPNFEPYSYPEAEEK